MPNSTLPSDIDRLLQLHQPPARVERHDDHYEIEFRHGTQRLLVSVFFDSRSYRIGSRAPLAPASAEDVRYAHWLFQTVQSFIGGLVSLGLKDQAKTERVEAFPISFTRDEVAHLLQAVDEKLRALRAHAAVDADPELSLGPLLLEENQALRGRLAGLLKPED